MTYQDEFARRLAKQDMARNTASGDPVEPRLSGERHPSQPPEQPDAAESRHPEPVSGSRTAEPADGGANTPCHAELDSASRAASHDGEDRPHPNPASGGSAPGRSRSVRGTDRPDAPEEEGLDSAVRPEPVEGQLSSGKRPSKGSGLTDTTDSPSTPETPTRTIRHDGWHPDLRVKFLEALARTGNVQSAAYYVQLSRQSAYDLRRRDPDFARAWLAALVLARDVAEDALQERAIDGIEEPVYYHGEVVGMRRRYDSRLLLAHLARLDKIAEQVPAQRGAARFGEMLEAIGKGEDTAPLIATPTADELAAASAYADALHGCQAPAEDEPEFYAVRWPDEDSPPEYYRMSPEEAAEMEREVPGLTATPTGTSDDAMITAIVDRTELELYATGQYGSRRGHAGMNS